MLTKALLLGLSMGVAAFAQNIVSARAGLVHYTEGDVRIDGAPVENKITEFASLRAGSTLRTGEGRAELLLTPGTFLRIGENSSIRMLSDSLTDARVEVVDGSAVLEAVEISKEQGVTVVHAGTRVEIEKGGVYRFDSDSQLVSVYEGAARIESGDSALTLKSGRQLSLAGGEVERFDNKVGDPLLRWSKRRAGYIAAANISAAAKVRQVGGSLSQSAWHWNPHFAMFTFIPMRSTACGFFGDCFFAPRTVHNAFYRQAPIQGTQAGQGFSRPGFNPNLGYSTAGRGQYSGAVGSSGSYGGGAAASSAPSAASAPSNPRSGGDAVGRGSSAGGGRAQ